MTGPEHLAEGMHLLAVAEGSEGLIVAEAAMVVLRKAELHFLAAQVIATVECANRRINEDWYDVIGRTRETD